MTHRLAHDEKYLIGVCIMLNKSWLLAVLACFAISSYVQTSVLNNGSSTTIIALSGVTTVKRLGNGNYNIVGPDEMTSVFSSGSGNYTVFGNNHVVPALPNGTRGYAAIGRGRASTEVLPVGEGGLLLIG